MKALSQKELLYLKRNYFSKVQKTLCKKFEQTGGAFTFPKGNPIYKFQHDGSKAYSDFIFNKLKHRDVGIMNRGSGPLVQDKYNKINHQENITISKLDYKIRKK